jgi:polyhydroxybutyrate depolymerase
LTVPRRRAGVLLGVAVFSAGALLAGCKSSSRTATTATTARTGTTTASPPAASGPAGGDGVAPCQRPHPPGQSTATFDFQGQPRSYQLYVPRTYAGHGPVPLVLNFHGYGSSAVQQMIYGDFRPLAERDTFLIVAPDGQGTSRHFNLTSEPGLQDDIAMVNALVDDMEKNFCVDTTRIYSTGMSDGGAMTSALACRDFDRFAAFGAVAVILYLPGCGGPAPVAITAFMGTADPIVPFDGGKVNCCGGAVLGSAPQAMAEWAKHDTCAAAPTEERLGSEVRRQTWTGCGGSSSVVFYIVDGGGHTWPGAIAVPGLGLTTQQVKASETIWEFFKAHPLAR